MIFDWYFFFRTFIVWIWKLTQKRPYKIYALGTFGYFQSSSGNKRVGNPHIRLIIFSVNTRQRMIMISGKCDTLKSWRENLKEIYVQDISGNNAHIFAYFQDALHVGPLRIYFQFQITQKIISECRIYLKSLVYRCVFIDRIMYRTCMHSHICPELLWK